jgi:hypothetical protein
MSPGSTGLSNNVLLAVRIIFSSVNRRLVGVYGLPVSVCDLFRILIFLFTMHNFEVTRFSFSLNGISSRETLVSTRCSQVGPECA